MNFSHLFFWWITPSVIYKPMLKNHSIFNWMQILTNQSLNYIIFVYSPYLQNFKMTKINSFLNSSFCSLKYCIKDDFKDQMVNYTRLAWKLACILRTYKTCNPTVGFSKYEFNYKLLGGVTFLRVTLSVIRTQLYIS